LGTALQLITAGYVADRWGWSMIFYSVGLLGVIWTLMYILLGSSSPQSSAIITAEEKEYIQSSLGTSEDTEVGINDNLFCSGE
jgi:sugar phosphate permease